MRLKDKVALVTGASQGIGEAIAVRYGAEGATVAVNYSKSHDNAVAVVERIKQASGKARAFRADCARVDEIDRLVGEVTGAFGRLDILVNNAGVFRTVPVEETTEAIWDEQLALNLKGSFFLVKAALPIFRRQGGGKVINITSIFGTAAFPGCAGYCASKGGLVNLTRALAAELGKEGINVNSIAPGNVATPLNAHLRGPGNEAYVDRIRQMTPTEIAFLDPEDLVGAAVFLASDDARMVHGETIMVDAAWSAW